jgi:hypothetical protein
MRSSGLVFFLCAATLLGQDKNLDPGLHQLPPQKFDEMLRKGLEQHRALDMPQMLASNTQCSIPLLEYHVKHPEQYTIRRLPVQPKLDPMAKPAGPVCKW